MINYLKYVFIWIFIMTASYLCAQQTLGFKVSTGSFMDSRFSDIYTFRGSYVALHNYYPVSAGTELSYNITPRWSVLAGYNFLYRYIQVSLFTNNVGEVFGNTKTFSSEFPMILRYSYSFHHLDNFTIFSEAGISMDYSRSSQTEFGDRRDEYVMVVVFTYKYFYTLNFPQTITPSFHARIGISDFAGKAGRFDFGIRYHLPLKKNIYNELYYYYSDNNNNTVTDTWEFYTKASYVGIDLDYTLPWEFKIAKNKKQD